VFRVCAFITTEPTRHASVHRLYRTSSALPVTHWDISPASIVWLHWSVACPGVFFVVDSTPCVHLWNLLVSDKVRLFPTIIYRRR
jgi:hypothetical protein